VVFSGSSSHYQDYALQNLRNYPDEDLSGTKTFIKNSLQWLGRGGKNILIDQTRRQCSPTDTGQFGIEGLDSFLKASGYEVTYNSYNNNTLTFENMTKFDVVILLGMYNPGNYFEALEKRSFSEIEITGITDYVEGGGGLLLMASGEQLGIGTDNDIYNPIANEFGVYFNNNSIDWDWDAKIHFTEHPTTANLTRVLIEYTCTLTLSNDAVPLISVNYMPEESDETDISSDSAGYNRVEVIATVSSAALIITLTVIAISIVEAAKYKFFGAVAVQYSRLRKERLLDNETREVISSHIQSKPGDHYNSIKKVLGLPNGSLAYHLRILERDGLVTAEKDGMYKRFYPADARNGERDKKLSDSQNEILDIIKSNPGMSQKDIAEQTDLTLSTVNYHINSMAEEGVVRIERIGNRTSCYLND
jgi:predicted transcriptional regulator